MFSGYSRIKTILRYLHVSKAPSYPAHVPLNETTNEPTSQYLWKMAGGVGFSILVL